MSLRKGFINTASNAVQRAAVLIVYLLAARGMPPEDFGVASSLITLAIAIGSLSSLSLGQTANRTLSRIQVPRLRSRMAVLIAQASLVMSIISTATFIFFSASLTHFVTGSSVDQTDLYTIALLVFSISLSSGLKGHIWAELRYLALFVSSAVSAAVLFLVYVILWYSEWSLPLLQAYAAMAVTEAAILGALVLIPLAKSQSLLTVPILRHLRPVIRFSSLSTLNGLITTPVNIIIVSMINASLGNDVAGRFNILMQIRNAIVFLPNGFASVILTLMSRARRPADLWRNAFLLSVMAGIASVPICIIANIWRPMESGTDYISLLVITSTTAMMIAFNTNIGQAFIALGRLWVGIVTNIIWSLTTLGLLAIVLMFETSGLEAVLMALLLAYLVHTVVQLLLIFSNTKRHK